MNAEADTWIRFAVENLQAAVLCRDEGLFNPAIQNAQQAVEKALKACCIMRGLSIERTHSIARLVQNLQGNQVVPFLSEEESALLDSVYLPSKYPLGSVLPNFEPDLAISEHCIILARRVVDEVQRAKKQDPGIA